MAYNCNMFLQLADNDTENYVYRDTNQGGIYIRRDLAAAPKIIGSGKISGAIAKVAPVVSKVAAVAPIPGASAVSTAVKTAGNVAAKIAATKPATTTTTPLKNLVSKVTAATAGIKTAAPSATTKPAQTVSPETIEPKENKFMQFIKQYKMPLLIGGGTLLVGGLILSKRKK